MAPIPGRRDKSAKKERRRQEKEAGKAQRSSVAGEVFVPGSMGGTTINEVAHHVSNLHMDNSAMNLSDGAEPVLRDSSSQGKEDEEMEEV